MTGFNYCILADVREEVEIGAVLDRMKGYINRNGRIISFSIMKDTVYLHYGNENDLQMLRESMKSIDSTKCITNNWKAFSSAEKAFLYIETKELYKVWISE